MIAILARIRNKGLIVKIFAVLVMVLCLNIALVARHASALPPIPAGCPGSTLAGPPGPGVCEAIPAGCQGSTQPPVTPPPTDCPYGVDPDDFQGFGDVNKNDCQTTDEANCGITRYIVTFINALSALAGVVIVASLVVAGIQYSSAADDPAKIQAAKNRITNSLFALFVLIFFYAFLQWVVPGGVL